MCVLCMIVQNVCLVCGLCDVYVSDVCTVGCVQVYGVWRVGATMGMHSVCMLCLYAVWGVCVWYMCVYV